MNEKNNTVNQLIVFIFGLILVIFTVIILLMAYQESKNAIQQNLI